MRIISWNIARRDEPWRTLADMDVDLALLQEAKEPPPDVAGRIEVDPAPWEIAGGYVKPQRWRAAIAKFSNRVGVQWIYSKPLPNATASDFAVSLPGSLTAVKVTLPDADPIILLQKSLTRIYKFSFFLRLRRVPRLLRSLARRKLRTSLTILGIAVGIWTLIVMSAMANKLTAIVDVGSTYFDNKILVSDVTNPAFGFGLTPMPASVADQIAQISGVAVAAPRVQFLLDPDDSGSGFVSPDFVVAYTAGFDQGYETFRTEISQGRETTPADEGRQVVVLGADLARKFDSHPGGTFDIRGVPFEVIGVLEPTLTFFDTTAVIPWIAGQKLLARDRAITSDAGLADQELTSMVIVYPEAEADVDSLIQAIETSFPGLRASSGEDFDEQFGSTIAIFNAIILSVALISVVVGGLSVINTMTISVAERTREIGIKRAIGATRGRIMRELVWEAGVMGFVGGLAGLGLAGLVVYFSNDAGQVSGIILFRLTPWIAALGVTFSTILGALAGVLPAWKAARLDPVEALGYG